MREAFARNVGSGAWADYVNKLMEMYGLEAMGRSGNWNLKMWRNLVTHKTKEKTKKASEAEVVEE